MNETIDLAGLVAQINQPDFDTKKAVKALAEYLYDINDRLNYAMLHLGAENFTDAGLASVADAVWQTKGGDASLTASGNVSISGQQIELLAGEVAKMAITTDGLSVALKNQKLLFNENGLTIENGGFKILRGQDTVFGVDDSGNLNLVGVFNTGFVSNGDAYSSKYAGSGLHFYFNNVEQGCIRQYGGTGRVRYEGSVLSLKRAGEAYERGWFSCDGGSPELVLKDISNNTVARLWEEYGSAYMSLYGLNVTAITSAPVFSGTARFMQLGPGDSSDIQVRWGSSTKNLNYYTSTRASKKNIKTMTADYVDMLLDFRPVTFNFRSSGKFSVGLIAEEVHDVCPCLCTYMKNPDTGNDEVAGVNYDLMSSLLIKGYQHMNSRIKALEEKAGIA